MDMTRTVEIAEIAEERLQEIARERDTTPRAVLEDLIEQEFELMNLPMAPGTEYPETPEAYRDAIRVARESIEREGTIPGKEIDGWLRALANGENPPTPRPSLPEDNLEKQSAE